MLLHRLKKDGLIHPPPWLPDNCTFMSMMGSVAYGVSTDASDMDVYGFAMPPKDMIFPHLSGELLDFGKQKQRFNVWQEHHIKDKSSRKEYDFQIYSIVKYFNQCMDCNPNMIDSLFVPERCIMHSTQVSDYLREHRHLFLHKGAFHRFKGYAYSQLHKIDLKTGHDNPKRNADIQQFGFDLKYGYHLVRLVEECEQILITHDLDITKNREQLKSIRRGEWTLEQLKEHFFAKEKDLETLYVNSTLQKMPDENAIKQILMDCLEMHYGSLSNAITIPKDIEKLVKELDTVINKYRN